ncbi:hypothetical protein ACFLZ7_01935 [Nanoarchaeota archaeon]
MNVISERITNYGMISKVEADNIKAKTRLINHTTTMEWVRMIIAIVLGLTITLIGLILFLKNNDINYIALMTVGVFILTASQPKIEEIMKNIHS